MLSRLLTPSRAARHQLQAFSNRGFASTSSVVYKEAAAVTSSNASSASPPDESIKSASSGPSVPSSCPAGTVLSGLSLYKDRSDPVALPDSEYPAWLWNILDDPSTTSASGASLESTVGLSKGEARAVQKRNLRAVRAAARGKGKQPAGPGLAGGSGSGAGMGAVGAISDGEVEGANAGEAERAQGEAAMSVQTSNKKSAEEEKEAKKALRKASRASIKAKNFIGAR